MVKLVKTDVVRKTEYVIKTPLGLYYRSGSSGYQWTTEVSQAQRYEFMTMANYAAMIEFGLTDFTVEAV